MQKVKYLSLTTVPEWTALRWTKGTVLFSENMDVVAGVQEKLPSYAENLPIWAEHSTVIAKFRVWSALHRNGIGFSLQHYFID